VFDVVVVEFVVAIEAAPRWLMSSARMCWTGTVWLRTEVAARSSMPLASRWA
jgi:hypothetical protein